MIPSTTPSNSRRKKKKTPKIASPFQNSSTSGAHTHAVTACVCAPLVEEFWKGLAIFGVFFFLRREFDGVVDGIIYATFCALGFAAVENITYYARAAIE